MEYPRKTIELDPITLTTQEKSEVTFKPYIDYHFSEILSDYIVMSRIHFFAKREDGDRSLFVIAGAELEYVYLKIYDMLIDRMKNELDRLKTLPSPVPTMSKLKLYIGLLGGGDYGLLQIDVFPDATEEEVLRIAKAEAEKHYDYNIFKDEEIIKKFHEAIAREKEKIEREVKKNTMLEKKFAEAKRTGEPVIIGEYITSECQNGEPDCSFDRATVFAMPDGQRKTTYKCQF